MSDRWITFDCFGTLVSWQRGFPLILQRVAGERAEELAATYHRFEAELERGTYRSYREILRERLVRAAESIAFALGDGDRDILSEHWDEQPVFEDVAPELSKLRQSGWKLAPLTNCDKDLFERTRATIPVQFDLVVTAQDVQAYKPALNHFQRFDELTQDRSQWIHVACSWFHDISPASRLGISRVWIDRDRTGEDPHTATAYLPSLQGLAETVAAIAERAARPAQS